MNEQQVLETAKVCYEVNRVYCECASLDIIPGLDDVPQWTLDSYIVGVKFKLSDPNATQESQHKAWMDSRLKEGWVYGEFKDPENKIHPCLVEYHKLPQKQRVKDYLFQATVQAMEKYFNNSLIDSKDIINSTVLSTLRPQLQIFCVVFYITNSYRKIMGEPELQFGELSVSSIKTAIQEIKLYMETPESFKTSQEGFHLKMKGVEGNIPLSKPYSELSFELRFNHELLCAVAKCVNKMGLME